MSVPAKKACGGGQSGRGQRRAARANPKSKIEMEK
jgi:hypothetical protein